jgi:hypothetical protein
LFEFSLAPWLESHDTRNEEVFISDITEEYYKSMENDFSNKYKKKYKVKSQSFRELLMRIIMILILSLFLILMTLLIGNFIMV